MLKKTALLKPMTAKRGRHLLTALGIAALVIALTVSAVSLALADTTGFSDVPSSHPYYVAVNALAEQGVVSGYGTGAFGPSDPVMRQQFAKMIVLAGGYPVSEDDICHFVDVDKGGPSTLYPDNYVAVCAARGITTGYTATLFKPYDNITRYQVISMVVRAAVNLHSGLLATPPAGWTATGTWGSDPTHGANAARAQYNGLLDGLPLSSLDPRGNMSRGEVAQVLYNLIDLATPPTTTTTAATTTTTTMVTTTTSSTTTSSTTSSTTTSTTLVTAGYRDLGGDITSAPGATSWGGNRLDVFARGAAGQLAYISYDGEWSKWKDLGGSLAPDSCVAAVSSPTHPIDVLGRGADNTLVWKYYTGTTWSSWESIPAKLTSGPAVVALPGNYLMVFARSSTGTLTYCVYDGANWAAWQDLGGALKAGSDPAAISCTNGQLDVFVQGTDNALWRRTLTTMGWSQWTSLGGSLYSGPAVASQTDNQMDVFVRGPGLTVWQKTYSESAWSDWKNLEGGAVAAGLAAASWGVDSLHLFARSSGNTLLWKSWNGYQWTTR